ncbi:MucBP domain-containing protein [Lactococcus garvieae]
MKKKKFITLSALVLMSVQSGLGPAGEVIALQEEENKKDLVISSKEETKEDIREENIEEKTNEEITNEEITDQSELVEVTEKENKKSTNKENDSENNVKAEGTVKGSVVSDIAAFIEKSSFSEMINVFSDSLFGEVPERDTFEGQKYELTDLEKIYNEQIKGQAQDIAPLLVSVNSFDSFDEKEVKKQVILLSYLMRWGTFSDDSTFWTELYSPESTLLTGEEVKALNKQFIGLFESDPTKTLASKEVNTTFATAFKGVGKSWTYKQSVEEYLSQVKNVSDYSEWFYQMFTGKMYKDHYQGTTYDVGIWNRGDTFNNFLPYLLTQSKTSNLMIGETRGEIILTSPAAYGNDQEKAEQVLLNAMTTITNTLELYDRTIEDKEVMNVDKVVGLRAALDQGRKWLDPEDSLSYELYRVAGYTSTHGGAGAVGGTGQIVMQATKLNDVGTVAHELGHELNSLFNADSEFYTTYIDNAGWRQKYGLYVNTYANGKSVLSGESLSNSSTTNFQNKADLVNYAKNMEDMSYALDALVAQKVLALPIEEQAKYIKIAYVNGENGALNTEIEDADTVQVKDLTVEELKKLNIKSVEDLIDHDAVIMEPSDSNKNILRNKGQGYGTTITYSAFFLTNGKKYHHNHRIINTLLAENGWEAFKTFNTTYNEVKKEHESDGLSDDELNGVASLAALRKVYNDDTLTYRSLMKKRYQKVMKKVETEGLIDRSYDDFSSDLQPSNLNDFYNFKLSEMTRYMNLSQEFSRSAFGLDDSLILNVSTYTELYEAVKDNPSAIINLSKDFKVDDTYASQELPEFRGTLNGQGHTISGAQHALFDTLDGATVKNLIISDTKVENVEKDKAGGLANSATNSTVKNVHIVNPTLNIKGEGDLKPFVGGLIGNGVATQISDSSVQEAVLSGSYVGGLVGRADGVKIYNSYTTGEVSNSRTGDLRIGGIVGNGFNKTTIKNAYTTMTVQEGNGILGSDYVTGNKEITISNTLSLANVLTGNKYKVYDYAPVKEWKNNYEVEEHEGKSSGEINNQDVKTVSSAQINTKFFTDTLNFGKESIWKISNADSINNLPTLKNDDPRYVPDAVQGGNITVHYQDESGKKIADDVVLKGEVGTPYTASKKTIKGYTFKEVKGKASGEFTDKAQTVTYVYKAEKTTTPANKQETVNVYRLYNKKSKEHLYTSDSYEYKHLPEVAKDWVREGVNFKAYKKSDSTTKAVYRVYNPKSGEHLNTTDANEVKVLKSKGWKSEGVAFYAPKTGGKPVYRLFNPKAGIGAHFMTADAYEKSILTKAPKEWKYEGIAWFSVK